MPGLRIKAHAGLVMIMFEFKTFTQVTTQRHTIGPVMTRSEKSIRLTHSVEGERCHFNLAPDDHEIAAVGLKFVLLNDDFLMLNSGLLRHFPLPSFLAMTMFLMTVRQM